MLKKNIYLTYPAGYTGNYINWIIHRSERDLHTVDQPVTGEMNTHHHVRIPTHQNFNKTMTWMIYNKPQDCMVYPINTIEDNVDYVTKTAYAVQNILRFDADPVIINIHDNNDDDIRKFAAINMVKKWSIYLDVKGLWHNEYNPYNDPDEDAAVAYLRDNWRDYIKNNPPVNTGEVQWHLDRQNEWFRLRNEKAPHEVTTDYYHIPKSIPDNTVYDVCVKDTIADNFIDTISGILYNSDCGDFDFAAARDFHPTFIESQTNKRWFEDIQTFRSTGTVSDWLMSDILTKSFVFEEKKQKNS